MRRVGRVWRKPTQHFGSSSGLSALCPVGDMCVFVYSAYIHRSYCGQQQPYTGFAEWILGVVGALYG